MTVSPAAVITVTDLIPANKEPIGFIITGGTLQSHFAYIWKNLANGDINISFRTWSETFTLIKEGTVSGIILCI